jgi:hypothetical protein
MAFNLFDTRNEFLNTRRILIWFWDVDGDIEMLNNIDSTKIKNNGKITRLIAYLNRMCYYIFCYAWPKALGLRNSSNRAEKANDIIVAKRQKRSRMSWSREGSSRIAIIARIEKNCEPSEWPRNKTIFFKLVPLVETYEPTARASGSMASNHYM